MSSDNPAIPNAETITGLYLYPVKGLSGQSRQSLRLTANEGIIGDRAFAIARKQGVFDPDAPVGLPKSHFLMLMRDEALALLDCEFAESNGELVIRQDGRTLVSGSVESDEGRSRIEQFFKDYLEDSSLDPDLAFAPQHKFTDISRISPEKMRAISLVNLNSVRALESATGKAIDPLRFRANIYFDGVPAWREFDWIDRPITIGGAKAKVVMRTTRCAATQVNPETAERDINVPKQIREHFGHADMGIYAEIYETGDVAIGGSTVALIE